MAGWTGAGCCGTWARRILEAHGSAGGAPLERAWRNALVPAGNDIGTKGLLSGLHLFSIASFSDRHESARRCAPGPEEQSLIKPRNMIKRLLPVLPFVLSLPALAQDPLTSGWAVQVGGATIDESIDVAVDDAGNTYAVGYFTGTAEFGTGSDAIQLVSGGQYDAFVMKLDTLGQPIWAHRIGGSDHDIMRRVVVDGNGDILVFGEFQTTVDLDPGPGEELFVSGAFTSRAFVLKLTGDGAYVWAKALGLRTTAASMELDPLGNIYLGGSFAGVTDLDPGAAVLSFTSFGGTDGF